MGPGAPRFRYGPHPSALVAAAAKAALPLLRYAPLPKSRYIRRPVRALVALRPAGRLFRLPPSCKPPGAAVGFFATPRLAANRGRRRRGGRRHPVGGSRAARSPSRSGGLPAVLLPPVGVRGPAAVSGSPLFPPPLARLGAGPRGVLPPAGRRYRSGFSFPVPHPAFTLLWSRRPSSPGGAGWGGPGARPVRRVGPRPVFSLPSVLRCFCLGRCSGSAFPQSPPALFPPGKRVRKGGLGLFSLFFPCASPACWCLLLFRCLYEQGKTSVFSPFLPGSSPLAAHFSACWLRAFRLCHRFPPLSRVKCTGGRP